MPGTDGFAFSAWLRNQAVYVGPVIMMLPFSHLKRKPECAALGVGATVVKPCSFRDLMRALNRAAVGREAVPQAAEPAPVVEHTGRLLRILVAEDTPFNQKFILRLLERWGHSAELAQNGREAVEAFAKGDFDMVLMDVQMPEMDGLEAAAAIRNLEAAGGRRTPIVAMTAHAIKGDRERCLAAGMDDYVSKPIDSALLKRIIDQHLAEAGPNRVEEVSRASETSSVLLKDFDNDWSFMSEVVEVFLSDYPRQLETLRRAIGSGDSAAFRRAAHSLKGMLRNFRAETAAEKAFDLEKIGATGHLENTEGVIEALERMMRDLERELRRVVTEWEQRKKY
jgi:CheY-like chemotaxis protein